MDTPLVGVVVVLGSMLLSVIGLVVVRRTVSPEWLKRHHELAGYYFHTIATLYAVLIAFAIYVVWNGYKDAGTNLSHEATQVADLSRLSTAMPIEMRKNVSLALMEYLNAVVEDEFPAMQQGRDSARTWAAVQRLWDTYSTFQPDTPRLQGYFDESLVHLTLLSDLRRTRLFATHGSVPGILSGSIDSGGRPSNRLHVFRRPRRHCDTGHHDCLSGRGTFFQYVPDPVAEQPLLRCRPCHTPTIQDGAFTRSLPDAQVEFLPIPTDVSVLDMPR